MERVSHGSVLVGGMTASRSMRCMQSWCRVLVGDRRTPVASVLRTTGSRIATRVVSVRSVGVMGVSIADSAVRCRSRHGTANRDPASDSIDGPSREAGPGEVRGPHGSENHDAPPLWRKLGIRDRRLPTAPLDANAGEYGDGKNLSAGESASNARLRIHRGATAIRGPEEEPGQIRKGQDRKRQVGLDRL